MADAHASQSTTLNRLSSRNVREMVALVAARNALPSESVDAVVERAVGVPLFIEELTRAVLESGSLGITSREIPATLHDSLMARLDRLGAAKEVVQVGAVIGSEFSYRLLHAVRPMPDQDLQAAIQSATDAELIYVRGMPPDANYLFKHALIRDAAYGALLRKPPQATPFAHCGSVEAAIFRKSHISARTPGSSLHGSRFVRGGDPLLATSRAIGDRALGQYRSYQSYHKGAGAY